MTTSKDKRKKQQDEILNNIVEMIALGQVRFDYDDEILDQRMEEFSEQFPEGHPEHEYRYEILSFNHIRMSNPEDNEWHPHPDGKTTERERAPSGRLRQVSTVKHDVCGTKLFDAVMIPLADGTERIAIRHRAGPVGLSLTDTLFALASDNTNDPYFIPFCDTCQAEIELPHASLLGKKEILYATTIHHRP